MSDANAAAEILRRRRKERTAEQLRAELVRYAPEATRKELERRHEMEPTHDLILLPSARRSLKLRAYLASALTGLTDEQREEIFGVGDLIEDVCAAEGIELYQPYKHTDPKMHAGISAQEVFKIDRDLVLGSDLLIHIAHYASTGSGEELDIAYNGLIPIILVAPAERTLSRMIRGIPSLKHELFYGDLEQLAHEMRSALIDIRPLLEERKLAFADFEANIVGEKIRLLREELQLTREEVADKVGIGVEGLINIEESSDLKSNPSLTQLRRIATVLRTTVAELVEPDLGGVLAAAMNEWLDDRQAARTSGVSPADRKKIIRRLMYRYLDHLDSTDD